MAWKELQTPTGSETIRRKGHVMRTNNGSLAKGGKANSNNRQKRNPATHIAKTE